MSKLMGRERIQKVFRDLLRVLSLSLENGIPIYVDFPLQGPFKGLPFSRERESHYSPSLLIRDLEFPLEL
jgi:hypothetical protein